MFYSNCAIRLKGLPKVHVPSLLLHLPPNLAAAAARNAVALRIELDPSAAPEPGIIPVLAVLQGWCGTQRPPAFIQLTRKQLANLADAAADAAVFVDDGKRVPWRHDDVLIEPKSVAAPASSPPQRSARAPASRRPVPWAPVIVDGSDQYLAITPPPREDPRYERIADILKASGFVLEPSNRKWWLRDRHKTLSFLAAHGERFRGEFGAEFTPNFVARTKHLSTAEITCEVSASGDRWDIALGIRGGSASEVAVRDAVALGRSYVEADGAIVLIDPARIRKLAEVQRALSDGETSSASTRRTDRIGSARAAEVEELLEELSPGFQPPEEWKRAHGRAAQPLPSGTRTAAAAFDSLLRPYQRLGAAWLWHLHRRGSAASSPMRWASVRLSRPWPC